MFTKICGWGLKIVMGLQYEISLFSSETVEGMEDWYSEPEPISRHYLYSLTWFWICTWNSIKGTVLQFSVWATNVRNLYKSVVNFTIYQVASNIDAILYLEKYLCSFDRMRNSTYSSQVLVLWYWSFIIFCVRYAFWVWIKALLNLNLLPLFSPYPLSRRQMTAVIPTTISFCQDSFSVEIVPPQLFLLAQSILLACFISYHC